MTIQEFPHQHTAHCESGVMSTLLKYHGHNLDEAMIFGIAHALTFVWMPLIKLNGMPLVSYRTAPRSIIKNTCKALGLKLSVRKFSDAQSGQAALDAALSSGKLAGCKPPSSGCPTSRRKCASISTHTTFWCTAKTATTTSSATPYLKPYNAAPPKICSGRALPKAYWRQKA